MSQDSSRLTLLVLPGSSSKVRQISIHRNLIYGAAGLTVIFGLIGGYGFIRLTQTESLSIKNLALKNENRKLKEENDAFQNSYARLKGQIDYVSDVSKDLARQAKMDRTPEMDNIVGTGGPENVTSLDHAAGQLERELRHINDRMKSETLRMSSVPNGLPVNGYITDSFGLRHNPFGGEGHEYHEGLDIAVDFGTPVAATADGLVIHAGPYSGYGNLVILYHSNGVTTRYGHLSRVIVEEGQRIKRGEQIGHAGSTGRSTGPHVHYEVRENDQPVDPMRFVGQARQ